MQVILAYNAIKKFWVGGGEGSVFYGGGRFFFPEVFQERVAIFWSCLGADQHLSPDPHSSLHFRPVKHVWSSGVCFFVFSLVVLTFFVLFYGHLLLIEIFKSLLFHAPTRQVFSSSCTSLFTSQPQLWVSEDLARMPFFDRWFGFGVFLALFV